MTKLGAQDSDHMALFHLHLLHPGNYISTVSAKTFCILLPFIPQENSWITESSQPSCCFFHSSMQFPFHCTHWGEEMVGEEMKTRLFTLPTTCLNWASQDRRLRDGWETATTLVWYRTFWWQMGCCISYRESPTPLQQRLPKWLSGSQLKHVFLQVWPCLCPSGPRQKKMLHR